MEHLSPDTMGRMVDDLPSAAERVHLDGCEACADELAALRRQTSLLGRLPAMRPFPADFDALEKRLSAEGLIQVGSRAGYSDLAVTPRWMRRAAAVALFVGGALSGGLFTARMNPAATAEVAVTETTRAEPTAEAGALALVERAERDYVAALVSYRQLTSEEGAEAAAGDPATRYAALDYLVKAGQVAVRQAPADPFVNGMLASILAEQQAVYGRVSTSPTGARQDGWF